MPQLSHMANFANEKKWEWDSEAKCIHFNYSRGSVEHLHDVANRRGRQLYQMDVACRALAMSLNQQQRYATDLATTNNSYHLTKNASVAIEKCIVYFLFREMRGNFFQFYFTIQIRHIWHKDSILSWFF